MLRRYKHFLGGKIFGSRFYNARIINCIRWLSDTYPNFIDVGAHRGEVLLHVANLFDRCIAVEPLPSSFRSLILNINKRQLTNIIAFQIALGEEDCTKTLYVPATDTSNCSLAKISTDMQEGPSVTVKKLDEIVDEAGLKGPFLIKIDVQGYELAVLKGAQRTLSRQCAVVCEFWPYGMIKSGYTVRDFIEYVSSKGYYPYDLELKPLDFDRLYRIGLARDRYVVMDIVLKAR